MKSQILFLCFFLLASCAATNTKEQIPLEQQLACQGLGIMAEDLAALRDSGLSASETFNKYEETNNSPGRPESMKRHTAFMTKAIFENKDLSPEAFNYVYNYSCMASMEGISLKIGTPYLIETARRCEDSIKRDTMLNSCISMAYTQLLKDSEASR